MTPLAGSDLDTVAIDLRWGDPDLDLDLVGIAPGSVARPAPVPASPPAGQPALDPPGEPDGPPLVHAVATLVTPAGTDLGRWLTDADHAVAARRGERGRPGHLAGRIAAKQALQRNLTANGFAEIDAHRIAITNDERGRPSVAVRGARIATRHARVTIAHSAVVAVAAATSGPATAGEPGIGIDVEPIEPRSSRFERLTLRAGEQALVPVAGDDRNTWLTRLWAAKEAAAKATGRGLEGRPKAFAASAVDGSRLLVAGRWIATEVLRFAGIDHVVALTDDLRTECAWHRS